VFRLNFGHFFIQYSGLFQCFWLPSAQVDYLNFFLLRCTNLLGTTYKFENRESIPKCSVDFLCRTIKYVCYDLVFFADFIVNLSARRSWEKVSKCFVISEGTRRENGRKQSCSQTGLKIRRKTSQHTQWSCV
jgi:hypothetical protein